MTIRMPAGEYFVGDPCYAVPEGRWMEWLTVAGINHIPMPDILYGELDGHRIVGLSTLYGDGYYLDQYGNGYGVDSGMIGLTPTSLPGVTLPSSSLGSVVNFEGDFEVSRSDDGVLRFGEIEINTGDDEDEEFYA